MIAACNRHRIADDLHRPPALQALGKGPGGRDQGSGIRTACGFAFHTVDYRRAHHSRQDRRHETRRSRPGQGRAAGGGVARAAGRARRRSAIFSPRCRPAGPIRLIAEVKKASPSQGRHPRRFRSGGIARIYQGTARRAISVLTDRALFPGQSGVSYASPRGGRSARAAERFYYRSLPGHRGPGGRGRRRAADRRMPGRRAAATLHDAIVDLGMTPLVELYEPANLPRVLASARRLVGINNRDLRTFQVDLEHTLAAAAADSRRPDLVGESGIRSRQTPSGWKRPASTPCWSAKR